MQKYSALILAGGKGRRMKSDMSKVLFELLSKPLIDWVIDTLKQSGAEEFCTIVGHKRELVMAHLEGRCEFAIQHEQLGTGHAVMMGKPFLEKHRGETIAVLSGDVPLIKAETLTSALERHAECDADATIITAHLPDPFGYGRVVRDGFGMIERIVEQRDATEDQAKINEINAGVYFFKVDELIWALDKLDNNNAQHEYYLTDVITHIRERGGKIGTFEIKDITEMTGINDRAQLYAANQIAQTRIFDELTENGVSIFDRNTTFISPNAEIGEDTTIYPCTLIKGHTKIGRGSTIGPNSVIENVTMGDHVIFNASQAYDSVIGNNVNVGPFSHIRPKCVIADDCKIGSFVEVKKTSFGRGTKAPHLSYIGDAELGSGVNFACGSITVNYDGKNKYKTKIGDNAFVGCNVNLIAPATIGDGAYIAAGSTITSEIPESALVVARSRETIKRDWKDKRDSDK